MSPEDSFLVVAIGASAGGLEACSELLQSLPPDTGMAFVLVQHLDPHHTSALPELLSAKSRMSVRHAGNGTRIQPNNVYVIPPNALMKIHDNTLTLEPRDAHERFRPIDSFFESLAHARQSSAIGVVLSGTASDGTFGLQAIKSEGGISFAQNQTARFDGMPRNAIAAGVVDFILSPREIAEELAAISRRLPHSTEALEGAAVQANTLHRLLLLVRSATGVDFTQYKQPTILRRVARRMLVRKAESLDHYLEIVRDEPAEVQALFDDMLINVTRFFRDPDVFETIKKVALPAIISNLKNPHTIRVWTPGCSTGEEVYSLAICLTEYIEAEGLDLNLQMFGCDISDRAIELARAGHFEESIAIDVSPERLRRFFVGTETGYQISRSIREKCIFSRHNIASDPPLSRMDLISCRNLLIYFDGPLQRRIIATFTYALRPGGCLILGGSESLGGLADHFDTLDERHKIYGRKENLSFRPFELFGTTGEYAAPISGIGPLNLENTHAESQISKSVNRLVLSHYGPPGLVVDEALRIIEYRGDLSPYLTGVDRTPDAYLMETVQVKYRAPLDRAVDRARRTDVAVAAEKVNGDLADAVAITVVPIRISGVARHFLILFGRGGAREEVKPPADGPQEALTPEQEVTHLRNELSAAREYLQSVIEELRSTNEEAQSANEELQSTNEELQTSKEELQSANEELNTINEEMHGRNALLSEVNDDLLNLLASMNVPIVMTGNDLRIRRFTPTAERVLRLIPADIGRSIEDIQPRINVNNLAEVLREVIQTLQPFEREVQDQEGRLYMMRVRAYRTEDNRIEGAVLQLIDVSDLRRSLEHAKHARDYAQAIVNTVREPLVVVDWNYCIRDGNSAFYSTLNLAPETAHGQVIFEVSGGLFNLPEVRQVIGQVREDADRLTDVEISYLRSPVDRRTLLLNARRLHAPDQQSLILMAFEDITDRKRAAEARYRRIFETARDGILLADAGAGTIFDMNPFAEQAFGYGKDELIGRTLWDAEPTRNLVPSLAAFEQMRDRGAVRLDDVVVRAKDGREIHTEVIANVYEEETRRAVQFNIRDVGERLKFQRELQETQKLESLGLLAGGVAHDFNNLLTGILGNASLAYTELPPDHGVRMHLRGVLQAAERAAFLTRQMLAYAGRGRYTSELIDLGALVREISSLAQTSMPKTVELRLDLAERLPAIQADPAQMQQVVMNLVINAAEAIGEGAPGLVRICTSLREIGPREAEDLIGPDRKPGAYVQLEVQDNGSGMDEDTKARIFDPFFTTKFTGRGLGLAAVQGIIKGHGGSIRVYSTPGQGTSFLILLPAARERARESGEKRASVPAVPEGAVALVIDDEEMIRKVATAALSRMGMKVLTAPDGKAGVEMFRKHRDEISVVVLDLLMPVMGGEEALEHLRQIDPEAPVIVSSGSDENEAARRFGRFHVARFLQKPYTFDRLQEAVAQTLERHGKR